MPAKPDVPYAVRAIIATPQTARAEETASVRSVSRRPLTKYRSAIQYRMGRNTLFPEKGIDKAARATTQQAAREVESFWDREKNEADQEQAVLKQKDGAEYLLEVLARVAFGSQQQREKRQRRGEERREEKQRVLLVSREAGHDGNDPLPEHTPAEAAGHHPRSEKIGRHAGAKQQELVPRDEIRCAQHE